MSWQIIEGDCRDVLLTLPARSVHTCVTSPPYFGLRDYGHDGQIGLELMPDEFVAALVGVFREVRRVLRDDGTVWLNLGDSYSGSPRGNAPGDHSTSALTNPQRQDGVGRGGADKSRLPGVKPKDLIGVPWMVAFALRADGWYLRSEVIWHKPNPMPESVTDRPTKAHEQVFLLSKSPRYFYDADAIRDQAAPSTLAHGERNPAAPSTGHARVVGDASLLDRHRGNLHTNGPDRSGTANRRSVWTVATQPYAGAHFATFPPKLVEPCILAGCPERCCSDCGAPWIRVVERTAMVVRSSERSAIQGDATNDRRTATSGTMVEPATSRTTGFEPSCDCQVDTVPGTVLDPFAGTGTTGMVSLRHGRSFVGIELSAEYVQIARWRIIDDCPLWNTGIEAVA